ncbi:MAG: dephospho-CoA kinase, partial [Phycisphaerae bacterium]|nr:dephospho-CoA kinase [Phycisphaerae bacterium]
LEKRKKLESFTHPRIYDEFFRLIEEISAQDPEVVIQVVIPLLIEVNMQYLFDKILVVSVSPETQARRLADRDGITLEEATNILSSQLPIEEKKGYADYVIDNEGSLEETKAQVENVWAEIQQFQKGKNQPD